VSVYRHISGERAHCYPVSLMCELLGVSESGYWAWCKRPPSDRELSDASVSGRFMPQAVVATAARGCTRCCAGRGSAWERS